ncbi:protein I'm not dead yet [Drosophila albomicans]|uniref:Protein I'm not dead yet n=2 Tax=nasuta subgroup TaxID=32307 RepID=A0A6P8WLY9_DROAB|nr:protein I'm not dead yet [Drosophila albomicans]
MAEEDYKPGQLPYPEQDERKKFCLFHYKGVLLVLIPLLFSPILLGPEVHAYRMIYLTVCVYLYYIFNVMAQGAIAFIFIVFIPICGISTSKSLCTAHYSDLIFETYGAVFIGLAMESSKLNERLATIAISFVGGNIRFLQFLLFVIVAELSFLFNASFVSAVFMKIAMAIVAEYNTAGILTANSEEETYERQAKPYPTWPVVGIYLTVCYASTIGAMLSPFQNPNGIILTVFNLFMKAGVGGIIIAILLAHILGYIVAILWIQIVFLGLFGGPVKEQVEAAAAGKDTMTKAMNDKKTAMGPWNIHAKLVAILLWVTMIALVLRSPQFTNGWDDEIHLARCGASVALIAACILFFAIPANYFFCRYYVCREPEKPGTSPSLVGWKLVNSNTPWAHIFMLAAGHGFVVGLRDSKLLLLLQQMLVRKQLDLGYCLFLGSSLGTLFTFLAPGTALARMTLMPMFKAGIQLRKGTGSVGIPYALSLHNQFLLPCSNASNTIVAGWGNLRPFQFIIGGIVPCIFVFASICIGIRAFGEFAFDGYLKVEDDDFKYTYKP